MHHLLWNVDKSAATILENKKPNYSQMWFVWSKELRRSIKKWEERGGLRGKFGNSVNYEKSPCLIVKDEEYGYKSFKNIFLFIGTSVILHLKLVKIIIFILCCRRPFLFIFLSLKEENYNKWWFIFLLKPFLIISSERFTVLIRQSHRTLILCDSSGLSQP